jgi:NADH dehydrogenase [ubiquinone] 1 alpha subcomplex assembly factor 7
LINPSDPRYASFQTGERIEISPDSFGIAAQIADRINSDSGAALIIDYGRECISQGSLRGIRKHEFVSPLSLPGETDLSIDVDFSFLKTSVAATGAKPHGVLTQADFLRSMGIQQRLSMLLQVPGITQEKRKELVLGYERLVGGSGVNGMGEIYKFLAVVPGSAKGEPYPFLSRPLGKEEGAERKGDGEKD